MQKVIHSKIDLLNSKLIDIVGEQKATMQVNVTILTCTIISVREWSDEDNTELNPNMCVVYLISGETWVIYTPYQEVIKILGWN
jgi:hypothetical protein